VLALAGEGVSPEPRSVAHAASTNTDRGAAAVRVLLADRATQPSQGELARLRQAHEDLAVSVLPGLRDAHPEDGLLVTRARGTAAEQGIGRLARDIAGLRVGIALGAGSNKGYAHITALEALERAGVPVDFLTGCSVGSIVGALRSLHEPPAEIARLLDAAAQHTFRPTVPVRSLISSDSLARFIRREGRGRGFADAFEPMAIVAADLVTRQEVVFRRGPYWRAIMASISIPGIFPPVQVGHHFLTDGGILNPVPTSVAAAMGADVVIGVKLARPPDAPEALEAARERPRKLTIVEVLQRSSEMMQSKIVDESASRATIIIEPRWPATLSSGLRDFSRGRQFMPYGAEAAESALPRLRTVLPWLHRIRT
jgi:NTE family protein